MDEIVALEDKKERAVEVVARGGNWIQHADNLDATESDGEDIAAGAEMAKRDDENGAKCGRNLGRGIEDERRMDGIALYGDDEDNDLGYEDVQPVYEFTNE